MAARNSTRTSDLRHRLTTQDASFLYGESLNGPTHVGMLSIFEGNLAFDQLVRHVEERQHLLPRYRQRLAFVPFNLAHATWEDDSRFNIENHIKRHQLEPGASEAEMIEAALRVFEPPLNRARPLWELHTFEGLEGERTGMLWKIHHCLVDGVSAVELTTVLMDFHPNSPPPPPPQEPWTPAPLPGLAETLLTAAQDTMEAQVDAAWRVQRLWRNPKELAEGTRQLSKAAMEFSRMFARPIVAAPWNAGLATQRRSLAWSRYPFGELRAIRGALGGTINDLVLVILSEAAARYLRHHGHETQGLPLRLGCPVNVRREDERETLGNRVSMMFPELPAEPLDSQARLEKVMEETERIKSSRAAQALELLTEATEIIPPSLMGLTSLLTTISMDSAAAWTARAPSSLTLGRFAPPTFGINFIATNVPGVQVPQYLAGHRCLDTIGLIPLAGTLGYGVAIVSYNQNLYFGMMAEPRLMPDVELMKSFVDESFEELKQTALAVSSRQKVPA